jgi:hypothetical protein
VTQTPETEQKMLFRFTVMLAGAVPLAMAASAVGAGIADTGLLR